MDHPAKFNVVVRTLFDTFSKLPTGLVSRTYINELDRKLRAGMALEPMYAITILGPEIARGRVAINARNADHFLARVYTMDLTRLCRAHSVNYNDATRAVAAMKEGYLGTSDSMREYIMTLVEHLLAAYVEWQKVEESRKPGVVTR